MIPALTGGVEIATYANYLEQWYSPTWAREIAERAVGCGCGMPVLPVSAFGSTIYVDVEHKGMRQGEHHKSGIKGVALTDRGFEAIHSVPKHQCSAQKRSAA